MTKRKTSIVLAALALVGVMATAQLLPGTGKAAGQVTGYTITVNGGVAEVSPTGIKATATSTDISPYLAVSEEYIATAHGALNEQRQRQGNRAVPMREDLNEKAAAHALEMAKAGKDFHSDYGLIESVEVGQTDAMHPIAVGAVAAVHAPQLQKDPTLHAVGIGAIEYDGKIYVCVLGDNFPAI